MLRHGHLLRAAGACAGGLHHLDRCRLSDPGSGTRPLPDHARPGHRKSLITALKVQKNDQKQADILERWAAHQVPPTIGTQCTVLLALLRTVTQNDRE